MNSFQLYPVKNSFLILFCIWVLGLSLPCLASGKDRVFLGISSPSTATQLGGLGHAFLVFQSPEQTFLEAESYSYYANIKDTDKLLRYRIATRQVAMKVEKLPFESLYRRKVVNEQTMIALHELKITPQEALNLRHLVRLDLEGLDAKYDLNNNCVMRLIFLINLVVSKEKQIKILDWPSVETIRHPELVLSRLPFYLLGKLKQHPLVQSQEFYLPVEEDREVAYFKALSELNKVATNCHWQEITKNAVLHQMMNAEKLSNPKTSSALIRLAETTCPQKKHQLLELAFALFKAMHKDAEAKLAIYKFSLELTQ